MSGKKPRVCFSVTNCICFDQRVLKIASVVEHLGCEIVIIGRRTGSCCEESEISFKTKRFRMLFKKGFLFYMFFQIRLFLYLLLYKADVLVANDLDTLLPVYLVSRIRKIPLVYDSHEYFTGVPELRDRPFVRNVWKSVEKYVFPELNYVMTVSGGIARLYHKEYGILPITVMNCSPGSGHIKPYSREELGINKDDLLVIFQGTAINEGRGGEDLVEAVALTSNVSLIVAGSGSSVTEMKRIAAEKKLGNRVKFLDRIPWDELMRYTRSAEAGASLDKGQDLNHLFSLPNKLFDYISAGLAVIASDLPEVSDIVKTSSCGIILHEVTPENIASVLNDLAENKARLGVFRKNSAAASEKLNWMSESARVSSFYLQILKENGYF